MTARSPGCPTNKFDDTVHGKDAEKPWVSPITRKGEDRVKEAEAGWPGISGVTEAHCHPGCQWIQWCLSIGNIVTETAEGISSGAGEHTKLGRERILD